MIIPIPIFISGEDKGLDNILREKGYKLDIALTSTTPTELAQQVKKYADSVKRKDIQNFIVVPMEMIPGAYEQIKNNKTQLNPFYFKDEISLGYLIYKK
ncbi:MAG: hypothetical protein PHD81_02020 [Candidatus Nanoarchaeia archaeon]|nr:hypothetical protein [Candidatus Nanoarchaeia archaeon]MDD5587866.1 hypothetical protein [Candidatus Nanoarchaeia archaeon]